jgi:hypothetical protein
MKNVILSLSKFLKTEFNIVLDEVFYPLDGKFFYFIIIVVPLLLLLTQFI